MKETLFKVAVDAPLHEPLTYLAPQESLQGPPRGRAVFVPLGQRTAKGVIVGTTGEAGAFELKSIKCIDEDRPQLHEKFLQWLEWLSSYYSYPLGQIIASVYPPLKKNSRLKSRKSPAVPEVPVREAPQLTDEQSQALAKLSLHNDFTVSLLHGVTGSGKTEIYMRLLERVVAEGGSAIVIVPEISLTPQLLERFAARFSNQIAVIHSHLTEREKTNQWWSMVEKKKKILIGARSALFCPLENLRMIIVDEEHEPSFKQDEKLKYHARDAAIMLAKLHNCPVVLGSATPSLDSWKNAEEGKYQLVQMNSRVANRKMPSIEVIDLKELRRQPESLRSLSVDLPFWMSPSLYQALQANLKRGQQSALFLNRRGMAQLVLCGACGYTFECPNCAISLTLHGKTHLVCHYCDYSQALVQNCPTCEAMEVEPIGLGTELVESDLRRLLPEARLARADRDEINSRQDLEKLISDMEAGQIDILIGTQMIAKGLDFPKLTLVGLVLADIGFNMPDFRATERSFQLITQMSGRSGRHFPEGGKVLIQTYNPTHTSLVFAKDNNYEDFARQELEARKELKYPPYGRLALLRLSASRLEKVERLCAVTRHRASLLKEKTKSLSKIEILGPCPAPLAKIRNQYRHQMLIKSIEPMELQKFTHMLLGDQKWIPSGTKVQIDIDPMNMF